MIEDNVMTILRDMAVRHNLSLDYVIAEYEECEIENDSAETLWFLEITLGLHARRDLIYDCMERRDIDMYNIVISRIRETANEMFGKSEAIR